MEKEFTMKNRFEKNYVNLYKTNLSRLYFSLHKKISKYVYMRNFIKIPQHSPVTYKNTKKNVLYI